MKLKIIYGFLALLLINSLLLLTTGNENVYMLPVNQLDYHQFSRQDTLIIESNPNSHIETNLLEFDTASEKTKNKILEIIGNGVRFVTTKNREELYVNNCCQSPVYIFTIKKSYLFIANVETILLDNENSTIYSGLYLYFFGWKELKVSLTGIS